MLKKLLVCGASLLMIASVGTGINNVSARRIHHHARTHRVIRSSRSLYNLGHKDGENYVNAYNLAKGSIAGTGTPKEVRQSEEADKQYTYHFIEFNYNKSYAKGFHKGYRDAGTTMMANEPTANDAKRFAHEHHLNSRNAYSYFYGKHSTKRTRRTAKRHVTKRVRKSVKRNKRTRKVAKRGRYLDFNPFTASAKTLGAFAKSTTKYDKNEGFFNVPKKLKVLNRYSPSFRYGFNQGNYDINHATQKWWNTDESYGVIKFHWNLRYNPGYAMAFIDNDIISSTSDEDHLNANTVTKSKFDNEGRKDYELTIKHPKKAAYLLSSYMSNYTIHVVR